MAARPASPAPCPRARARSRPSRPAADPGSRPRRRRARSPSSRRRTRSRRRRAGRPPRPGLPFDTDAMLTPPLPALVETPRYARWIVSPRSSRGITSRTVFDGTANPIPTLPPDCDAICELTPITLPVASSSGPPELPGLIGASVWITESIWKPSGRLDVAAGAGHDPGRRPSARARTASRSRPRARPVRTCRGVGELRAPSAAGWCRPSAPPGPTTDRRPRRSRARSRRRRTRPRRSRTSADHVRVGDDGPVGVDHEPGAGAAARLDRHDGLARGRVDRLDVAGLLRARPRRAPPPAVGVRHAERERPAADEHGGDEPTRQRARTEARRAPLGSAGGGGSGSVARL